MIWRRALFSIKVRFQGLRMTPLMAIGGDGGSEKLVHIGEKTGHDAAAAFILLLKACESHPPEIAIRCLNGFQSELLFSRRRLYSQDQLTVLPHAAAKYGQCMGPEAPGWLPAGGPEWLPRFFSFPSRPGSVWGADVSVMENTSLFC